MTHPHPDPRADNVTKLGTNLSGLASTPDDRDLLAAFADLLDVGTDSLGPLLLLVLVEPLAGAQIVPVGHACPGLTFRVNDHLDLRLILDEPIEFYDHDTDTFSRTPPKASQPPAPQQVEPPSPCRTTSPPSAPPWPAWPARSTTATASNCSPTSCTKAPKRTLRCC